MPRPDAEPVYELREVRFQATHVPGAGPTLAGIAVYLVTDYGQWSLLTTWDFSPFDPDSDRDEARQHCAKLLAQILS
jgi:hypothetical protein